MSWSLSLPHTHRISVLLRRYGERVGALVVVCESKDAAARVLSNCKRIARAIYSNPPTHGARIAAQIVNDKELFGEWKASIGFRVWSDASLMGS